MAACRRCAWRGRELRLGTFVRVGRNRRRWGGSYGRGLFFGLERRDVMGSVWLAAVLGAELDATN